MGQINDNKKRNILIRMFRGEYERTSITKNKLKIGLILFIIAISFIHKNEQIMRDFKEISQLKREISELKLEEITITSNLIGEKRISAIQQKLKEQQIDIVIPQKAPVVIKE